MIKGLALRISNLSVSVEGKEILRGVDLTVRPGKIHALMGPNGSGKSTLAYALAGRPRYRITSGKIYLGNKDITDWEPEKRAKLGLFLAFQHPVGVEGVSLFNLLRSASSSSMRKVSPRELLIRLKAISSDAGLGEGFLRRDLNFGLSGGEKKRSEVLQALALKPKFAVLDEVDSGLDIDALEVIAKAVGGLIRENGSGVLLITHYQRIFRYLKPDFVHVMVGGEITDSGGPELAVKLEKKGYGSYRR
ncbi:MAG: Fe-S cluster assembly ATPase SufC [Patescibacteria group bacterium]|nr:MAG: Fe-S cluster assembly ATPase SufC [Patescibacteria group bacterium]